MDEWNECTGRSSTCRGADDRRSLRAAPEGAAVPQKTLMERADRALELAIYYLSAGLMLGLTGVILYAVVARYFFNAAPSWSEEVPRVLFLWVTFLAIAVAMKQDRSLRVTFLLDKLPPAAKLWVELVMHASVFVMLAFLLWHNVPVIQLNSNTRMLATQWSDALRYWPLSVGCVLMGLYQLRLVMRTLAEYRTGRSVAP
jgi:TRAP-type C4-dicarboxylate transport system permease small subunit